MSDLILQLTDPHVGARWGGDPLADLRAVIETVRGLPDRPTVALVTGDLTNDGAPEHYAALAVALAELGVPVHVLPGNHDDRAALRTAFDVGGAGDEPIQYALALGELCVLMLDTLLSGSAAGELGPARLAWLAAALDDDPERPTLIAMHHPPFQSGMAEMDRIGLPAADREAFTALVADHPAVVGIVAGHVHRSMVCAVAGRPATTIPSTSYQLPLDLHTVGLDMVVAPLGFALHTLVDGRLVSHVQTLPRPEDHDRLRAERREQALKS